MRTKQELIKLVEKANKSQLWNMIYDFEMIGFYREDKRQQRKFIIECIQNCYTTEINRYGTYDSDSLEMEKSILKAINN